MFDFEKANEGIFASSRPIDSVRLSVMCYTKWSKNGYSSLKRETDEG
jgi:hypothetical protein